jgi:putative nucleotidyltransferase with HDIG domain
MAAMLTQKVDAIIQTVTQLRPMPSNISRIVREVEKADVTIDVLVGLVSLDQALAALVLQMSNSVSLGYAHTCSTLHEAIMYIGLARFKSILLTSSATSMLKRGLAGYRSGAGELWHHSLVTAVAAEWLAQALYYPNPEEAYISGLLHDVGKLLLDQYVLSDYNTIVEFVRKYQMPLWQVEEKLIGIHHAEVGGLIAKRWNFPISLVDAIRYHHSPSFAMKNQKLPAIVNLANTFADEYQIKKPDTGIRELHPESLNILKLGAGEVEKLKANMRASGKFPDFSNGGQVL